MTRFVDGPAAGTTLFLRRAPLLLRAVRERDAEWDALDQIEDFPKTTEEIVVYRLDGEPSYVHINRGRQGGGVYRGGTYRVVDPQPADADLRDVFKWRAWATAYAKRVPALPPAPNPQPETTP